MDSIPARPTEQQRKRVQLPTGALSPGMWTLPASLLAGSIIAGIFAPFLLLISLGSMVWLVMILRASCNTVEAMESLRLELGTEINEAHSYTARLQLLLDSADVPIIATDHEGSIIQANRAAKTILGSGRRLLGEYFDSLITQKAVRELEQMARAGEGGHARMELPVGGDMRVFDVAAKSIVNTRGAVCTFTDITELSRSATLKADFAANASHELRTPIASILGAVHTLEGPAKDDPEMIKRLIVMISTNASRLDQMVKDLLDLSKLGELRSNV